MTLSQPLATVITGALAVVAAVIAYRGIRRSIEAQRSSERRGRAIDQIMECISTLEICVNAFALVKVAASTTSKAQHDAKVLDLIDRFGVVRAKLELYGLTKAADAAKTYFDLIATELGGLQREKGAEKPMSFASARAGAIDALSKARESVEKW